ncbi:rRNA (cytosine-C5-)-methyltransferase NOP2 [Aspergillus novofumigatus IBT 16806]|uniref:Nucleolar protein 2 n=1 Tax=Aspergillus novofumigatus (strain IBT 16806) TaxID=1392255 RepID=A0A2I1CFQ7_ASPN1|nr:NOL1/NOP2/sun family putative RNA met [Aspergillus novofumigatus IBT 16806]PKX96454.1 NOL1/NOP2/sun family putative RNA met [Aspergillus novofumigatus IBT 16806]
MGKGRRMQKQGPPAPLDESKITLYKKRKAGDVESKAESGKKRRRAEEEEEVLKAVPKKKVNGAVKGKQNKAETAAVSKKDAKSKSKPAEKEKPTFMDSDDEDMSDLDDDEIEMGEDEFDDLDGVSDGSMDSQQEMDSDEEEEEDEDSVMDSEEEDHPREAMFSDDEDLSDAEEKLTAANIEGLSRKLDEARQAEEEEAQRELQESAMQTNIAGDRPDVFGDAEGKPGLAPDLQLLRTRITDTIRILGDLKTLGQPGKSRADYLQLLLDDICTYYGYTPFLAEKLFNLFTPMEAFAFFEANETPRPVVIRTNTLRTNRRSLAQALINRGVVLEPVGKWSKVGLQVFESAVPLGATPEYLAGHYILQAASSFLPVMALAPQPNERTTYISALMRNTGCVIANDASKPRAKGLIGNIHRLGCKNTIVTNLDARTAFPKALGGFDRVLLDAPAPAQAVKTSKNERDFLAIPHMQRNLLLAAIDSVDHASKTGGYIVYSTCSVTVEENEAVVQYVLRKRPNVKLVDTGLGDFGSPGFTSYMSKKFDPKMTLTRRYFPHRENVDAAKPAKKADDDEEVVDKTPILNEDGTTLDIEGGAFGPFDDEEDQERIARAERNRLRRKGLDPRAVLNKPKKSASEKTDASKQEESKKESAVENGDEKAAKTSDKVDKKADKKDKKADKSKTDSDSKSSKKNKKKAASSSPGKKAGK